MTKVARNTRVYRLHYTFFSNERIGLLSNNSTILKQLNSDENKVLLIDVPRIIMAFTVVTADNRILRGAKTFYCRDYYCYLSFYGVKLLW